MLTGTTTMDAELPVKLTDTEVAERGVSMARHMAEVERLRKKKADDAKSTQALIDIELDEAQRLGRVILDSFEMRKQGELTFEETQAALGKVAQVAGEARPGEPHVFVPQDERAGPSVLCHTCGSEESDPVHTELLAELGPDTDLGDEAPAVVDTETTPGDTPPAESVAIAKEHVTGGNGKRPRTHRTSGAKAARARGKAART